MRLIVLFLFISNLFITSHALAFNALSQALGLLALQGNETVGYLNKIDEKMVQEIGEMIPYEQLGIDNLKKEHYDVVLISSSQGMQDIETVAEILKVQGKCLMIISAGDSDEYQVIAEMAQSPRWSGKLATRCPPKMNEYRQAILAKGFTIQFSEIKKGRAVFEDGDVFKSWILSDIAPLMDIAPLDYELFAEDYMMFANDHQLIQVENQSIVLNYKQLILLFTKDY